MHLPWVKRAGVWPFGEEWLYQVMLGTYIPLLDLLRTLRQYKIRNAITVGVTPVLIEMLQDEYFKSGFEDYIEQRLMLVDDDIALFGSSDPDFEWLAVRARTAIAQTAERWRSMYGRDIIAGLREAADLGEIEILTSAATHAFLPLLGREDTIELQLDVGMRTSAAAFRREVRGLWLPECAFSPRLTPLLQRRGVAFFYTDARAIAHLNVPTSVPYQLPGVQTAFFVRDESASGQVWDNDLGYPGDEWYREFHRRHQNSGQRYWRVTAKDAAMEEKEIYVPARAFERVRAHAADFAQKLERRAPPDCSATFTLTFDAELFGHWWSEGMMWLEETILEIVRRDRLGFELPSQTLQARDRVEVLDLPPSSWGVGGDFSVWENARTQPYWEEVHLAEEQFARLRNAPASPLVEQAARELLLLQSSDWPFSMTNQDAGSYPDERVALHRFRFDEVSKAIREDGADPSVVIDAFAGDSLFSSELLNL